MTSLQEQKNRYIKEEEIKSTSLGYPFLLVILLDILYLYACWYVQTFSGIAIVIRGTVVGIIILFILHILQESNKNLQTNRIPNVIWINLALCAYFFIVGLFVAINTSSLTKTIIEYSGYIIASAVICYISTIRKSINWFLNIMLFTSLLCAVYALVFGDRYYGYGLRLSPHNNVHIFSLVLFSGIFALAYKTKDSVKSLLFNFVPSLLLLYCIIESTSRKCLIASLFILITWLFCSIWVILKRQNQRNKGIIVLIAIVVFGITIAFFFSYFLQSRLFIKFQGFTTETSNRERIDMYKMALDLFFERPLFGGGFNQYQYWSGFGTYSHSTYAEALADFGFFGTVLYFVPIILVGVRLCRLAFSKERTYRSQITLALYCMELFLGIGQIFFLEPPHIFILAVVFWIENNETNQLAERVLSEEKENKAGLKYIRKI